MHYKTKPLIGGIFFFKEKPPTIGQNYGSLTNRIFFKIDANFLKNLTMVQVFSGGTTLFGLRIIFSVNREVPIPSPDGEHERREKVDSAHSLTGGTAFEKEQKDHSEYMDSVKNLICNS